MCDVGAWLVIAWLSAPGALFYQYEHFSMLPHYEGGVLFGYDRSGYTVGTLDASTTEAWFGVYELPSGAVEHVNIHACGDVDCSSATELPLEISATCRGADTGASP